MSRVSIPGSESLRSQLGIMPEDPDVYRPITVVEAADAARLVCRDTTLPRRLRTIGVVGIVLDLMPGHLTPTRDEIARALRIKASAVEKHELEWEVLVDERTRMDLVQVAYRAIASARAANR